MNTDLLLRHATELAMIIPAAALAIMPVYECRKVKGKLLIGLLTVMLLTVICGGAVLCTLLDIASNAVIFPVMLVMFGLYHRCFDLPLPKKVFCFATAVFLCSFSTTYSAFLSAPLELDNPGTVYKISSGLICLGTVTIIGLIFSRTLLIRFPQLLHTDGLDALWNVLMIAPLAAAAGMIWMNPLSAENIMTGRLRRIGLVMMPVIPAVALFLYHIFWWLAKKLTETAQLQQSYDLLKMEEKQFAITQQYLQETSALRHDFRHHLHVIQDYAEKGMTEEQLAYIRPLADIVDKPVQLICKNTPLNAICSHYNFKAKENDIRILWGIDLEEKVPISEPELCSVIGNLLDNAIRAVSKLDHDRVIDLRMGMVSPEALAVSVKNPYTGKIVMNRNGLPVTKEENHGVGMRSVSNTVARNGGSMVIRTENGMFDVSIIMYKPNS